MNKKYSTVYNAGVLAISDKDPQGERVDVSGEYIRRVFQKLHINIVRYEIVPDEMPKISETLSAWADMGLVDFIITTGGTGLSPRDVTPEATLAVIDRELPGIAELMRTIGFRKTPTAVLSRAVAGLRSQCLIINLPGSPQAVKEYLSLILPVIPHAVDTLKGLAIDHHH